MTVHYRRTVHFEPDSLIYFLTLSKVTANPDIQLATINLLRNLIKLRVNYSLLDHDGVFLRVLRSQIECAEKLIWRISDCEQILPSIFSFLVSISDDTKGTDP